MKEEEENSKREFVGSNPTPCTTDEPTAF